MICLGRMICSIHWSRWLGRMRSRLRNPGLSSPTRIVLLYTGLTNQTRFVLGSTTQKFESPAQSGELIRQLDQASPVQQAQSTRKQTLANQQKQSGSAHN
ncbi:hypothetical protein KC19_VG269300 [Ceratodon purpureus]|uniref:Uncharacterized protein n=1 Tax=Ceratodon purpureus TaxID=3225 RepID=A0A8T0HUY7_CERPU|nr:hypothetical protein KC19_VG269300 [Ceratodon purpureus]